jgi:hypothetical protein
MNTAHRLASHAKHNPPSFDVSMLNYVAPTLPESLFLKSGPAPVAFTTKAAWDTKVLDGLQDQPVDNYQAIMGMTRLAFERLKLGTATAADFNRVACAFNVGVVRAEAIDFRAVEVMEAGAEALTECDRIQQCHRKYGFTGPGLLAAGDAMNLYEDIVRLSPPVLMEAAVEEVARRMLNQAQEVAA